MKDNSIGFSCDKDVTPGEFQGQKYDYVQRNICIDHLAAPIEQGRCPSPYCGINVDSAEDDKSIVEVQDSNLGISYRFDSAKFTHEKAEEWVQKRTYKDCLVCTRMEEVGLLTAAQRLYNQYGADVLEVIEGHKLPSAKDEAQTADQTAKIISGQAVTALSCELAPAALSLNAILCCISEIVFETSSIWMPSNR